MTAATTVVPASATSLLERIDPLAKVMAVLPAMAFLIFARDLLLPLLMIGMAVLLLIAGARLTARGWLTLAISVPVLVGFFGLVFALWANPERAPESTVYWSGGIWMLTQAGIVTGFATATRLAALVLLALVIGTTTTARQLVLAMITHLRLPYRVGYAILVGIRFVPQTRAELRTLDQARQVRGLADGHGPVAAVRRWWSYLLPLAAGGLRRASRVALAMDARAFGAHPTRTERDQLQPGSADMVFVVVLWAATALAILYAWWLYP